MAASRSRRVWLFDLDNTLHHASHAIFPEINRLMNAYIARVLGDDHGPADAETVNRVRLEYYLKYGVTMLGMVRHHGVDAEHFLQAAHDIDGLTSMIRAERGLRRRLRQLPGKKILLTNAPAGYAGKVLRHLRLHTHFDAHVPVEQMRVHRQLQPKPLCALPAPFPCP
jgi:putative hydrolase of the HAD superfamily